MNRHERRKQIKEMAKIGRLAFREEGSMWNAYYALTDTMKDALPIGSIAMAAIIGNDERKQTFMNLMREFVADIIEEKCGIRPEMPGAVPAPEHERAGHA